MDIHIENFFDRRKTQQPSKALAFGGSGIDETRREDKILEDMDKDNGFAKEWSHIPHR